MSADAVCVSNPPVLKAPGRHGSNKTSHHVARLDKQRLQQSDKNSNKSKNGQMPVNIPKTQVLPNGARPDFGNATSSKRVKNTGQKKGGTKEQKDLTRGLKSLYLPEETKGSNQPRKEGNGTKARSNSNASSGYNSNSTPASSTPPTVPTSPLEEPVTTAPVATPVVTPGASIPMPIPIPPSLSSVPGLMSNPMPTSTVPPPAGFQSLPLQPPFFGGPGYPYGNYAVGSMPYMNPQVLPPMVSQMYPQGPVPVMQTQVPPATSSDANTQIQMTPEPSVASPGISASRPNSKKCTNSKSTSFAGASFASKDPIINKLPKPSFA